MPSVRRLLVAKGLRFTNGFVVNPLCCPSRSSILTGNYSHTTGVYTNLDSDFGGWRLFRANGWEQKDIAVWLKGAGYRTGLIGKYLNGYGPNVTYVPPGWDRWVAFDLAGTTGAAYYDYDLNVNGRIVHHGGAPADYSTDVLAKLSARFIEAAPAGAPLFLYFAPFAPHGPGTPAPRDVGTVPTIHRRPPSFNERDVSDKPKYIRVQPPADPVGVDLAFTSGVESLGAEDDAVARIVRALADTGRLHNTLLVFMSDNGVLSGEHRWRDKLVPYEEAIRVPFAVRFDPLTVPHRGERDGQLVLNIDLAETFAQLAGLPQPVTDGRSLIPLLDGSATRWRTRFLVEHVAYPKTRPQPHPVPTYCAVRTRHRMYARYRSGFEELYDLVADPYELRNIASIAPRARREMRDSARVLCSPLPPGMPGF